MRALVTLLALLACLVVALPARAHKPSDAYLTLTPSGAITLVRWDVAVRDLDFALGLDADRDGKVTYAELTAAEPAIVSATRAGLALRTAGGVCELRRPTLAGVASHSDGRYAVLFYEAACPGAGEITVRYDFLFDVDPSHRAIVRVRSGDAEAVHVLGKSEPEKTLSIGATRSFGAIVRQGVLHIWTGYDHMLFLLALLLPAVLVREGKEWRPREKLKEVFFDVARIVTAFTAAHSITLSLAALGALALPSRFVESAIALSVVLAALNNLWPLVRADRWLAAFSLGLLHGFGFSSTLADLGLDRVSLLPTLVGFNLGVELGQAAVVTVALAAVWILSRIFSPGELARSRQVARAVVLVAGCAWLVMRLRGAST